MNNNLVSDGLHLLDSTILCFAGWCISSRWSSHQCNKHSRHAGSAVTCVWSLFMYCNIILNYCNTFSGGRWSIDMETVWFHLSASCCAVRPSCKQKAWLIMNPSSINYTFLTLFVMVVSAFLMKRYLTTIGCPSIAAKWRGVFPS